MASWQKEAAIILPAGLLILGLLGSLSIANAQTDISVSSEQFKQLCSQPIPTECEDIGKAAHLTTELIYELFDAEKIKNEKKRLNVVNRISKLYKAERIDTVNKRLLLSDFFITEREKVFGGYAALIRSKIHKNGRNKLLYVIAFKGTYNRLEDPNDIAAGISGLPANLYKQAAIKIHQGLKNYAGTVFKDAKSRQMLAEILSLQNDKNTDIKIVVTGHSLGGCAILYAAMLKDAGVLSSNMNIIVFGSSPVAQQSFVDAYRDVVLRITRIETEGDMLIYENESPMKPIYDELKYIPFGRLIKTGTSRKLIELNKQKKELQASRSEALPAYLNLMNQILAERVAIHIYSYRYYYQYYRDVGQN